MIPNRKKFFVVYIAHIVGFSTNKATIAASARRQNKELSRCLREMKSYHNVSLNSLINNQIVSQHNEEIGLEMWNRDYFLFNSCLINLISDCVNNKRFRISNTFRTE